MVPPLSKKVANFYQFMSRCVSESWLLDRMLALANKKCTFVPVSGFLAVVFS